MNHKHIAKSRNIKKRFSPLQNSLTKHKNISGSSFLRRMIALVSETDPAKLQHALHERIKELNCLYETSRLFELHYNNTSIDAFLSKLVTILPPSWQYPEDTCARIIYKGKTYKSCGFQESIWRQSAMIPQQGKPAGAVEVFYLKERPPADEGPFLSSERFLIDEVAKGIDKMALRISAQQELEEAREKLACEHAELEKANNTLRAMLKALEKEKQCICKNVQDNLDKIILPMLQDALVLELPEGHRQRIELLMNNLEEITAPFINHLSRKFGSLTPTEIKICNMIKIGLCTKEIAKLMGISNGTIERHREHIRYKLNITNQHINLVTYLQTTMQQENT